MTYQLAHSEPKEFHSKWFYAVSGASAFIVGGLLVIGAVELIPAVLWPGAKSNWLSPFQNNWLMILFKLHADFSDVQYNLLDQLNVLDLFILILVGIIFVGLYMALCRISKLWSLIALAQPILGMIIFIATKTAGRSSVMGAELVISMLMLRSNLFAKPIAFIGAMSALLLLAGDIGESIAPSDFLAILMGVGYVLLMSWLFLIGVKLLQLGQATHGGK